MKYFNQLSFLLEKNEKKKFIFIIFLFLILSFLEVIGIASVIPFITALFSPEKLETIAYLNFFADTINENRDILIPVFCLIFLLIFLLKNIFYIITNKFISFFVSEYRARIAKDILKKFLHQEFNFFMSKKQGTLFTIISSETQNFSNNFLYSLMILLSEIIILIGIFFLIIFSGQAKSFLVIIPSIIIVGLIIKKFNINIKKWSHERFQISQNLITLSTRIFVGIRDIYLSRNADKLIENFFSLSEKQAKLDAKNLVVQLIPKALLEISGIVILLSIILYFNIIGISNDIIVTNLTFYFLVAYRAIPSYNKILIQYQRFKYSKNSLEIIKENLALKDQRMLSVTSDEKLDFKKSINLKNISFSYEKNHPIIQDVNLEIKKGEIIGIFGESGSGKSTLLNLITLLTKQQYGDFFVDGKLLNNQSDIRKFQNLITFTSQDTFLIEDTIKNNIIMNSEKEFNEVKLNQALKLSRVDTFLNQFSEGLDYIVGSHSRKISSGQRQRIALARAFYDQKEILIFDEATNAIDEENEKIIFNNILNLKKSTIIIISHNKKNLDKCNKVFHLKNKKLQS